MTKSQLVIVSLTLSFLMAAVPVGAQNPADTVGALRGIEITTSVDRAEALIGDLIEYRLVITYDSSYRLEPPPLGANLGGFDVKDYQTDKITQLPDGRMRSENEFMLSTFTTGDYAIPPIPALFILPDSTRKVVLSEAVPIKIKSLLESESDSLDIKPLRHPVREPDEFENAPTDNYVWIAAAAAAVLILVAVIWWRLRRKKEEDFVDPRQPWEIAFEQLAVLKEKRLAETGEFKPYYIELTEVARAYLGKMYGVDTMEKTTEEFLDAFSDVSLPGNLYEESKDFLQHADMVKFAKYNPAPERAAADIDVAHDLVETVRTDQEGRVQIETAVPEPSPADEDEEEGK